VNAILLDASELRGSHVVLTGRRAEHVRDVLGSVEGEELRVGVLGDRLGTGSVVAREAESITLEVRLSREPPEPSRAKIILALPRPKVARRVLIDLTAAGVKEIHLIGAWKVDKSYWNSPLLTEEAVREHLVLGLEQGGDTVLPNVTCHRLFKPFVEDRVPTLARGARRFVAHPSADCVCPKGGTEPFMLAIGPERGFTQYEVERFVEAGFESISLGARTLRVEAAVATLLGRLS
jgi:RsmE family RNA methyltransferase